MRKVIFPLVIALALVASMSAAAYTAQVTMDIDPVVGATGGAELAFASAGGAVADDFVVGYDTGGGAYQVKFDFGNVQPDSTYIYWNCLEIINNKPFPVEVTIPQHVSGDLYDNLLAPGYATLSVLRTPNSGWGPPCDYMYDSDYTPGAWHSNAVTKLREYGMIGNPYNRYRQFIPMRLVTDHTAPAGTYTGTITFKAVD